MSPIVPTAPVSRRAFLAGLGVGAAGLLLGGCRSAVESPAGAAGATSTGAAKGGTLRIVQGADIAPTSVLAQNNVNLSFLRLVYNTLIEMDHRTHEPQPSLAEKWTLSPDGKHLEFTLRKDVTFHSGRPFTSADVAFTVDYVRRPEVASQLKHVAAQITKVSTPDDQTVAFEFGSSMSNVFDLFELLLILDKDTAAKIPAGTFVGTGPFVVSSYAPGSKLVLKRNEKYWKPSRPYLDGVEISIIRESQSMLASLRNGQSQLALDLAPLDASSLRSDPRFQVVVADTYDSAFYVGANTTFEALKDKRVRQAIAYAIDRERILTQVLGGIGQTSSLPWAPSSPAFDADLARTYARDVDKAKALLAAAGASGAKVGVNYNAGLSTNGAIAEIVTFDLKAAGLDATASPLQGPDFQAKLTGDGLPGLFVNNHGFGQLSPATLVKGSFPFNADKNAARFDNADYKALANRLWTTTEPAGQKAAQADMNKFLLDQQFIMDLVVSSHTFTIAKQVRGLGYTMFDYLNLDEAQLG
ncbi:MAG: ABC transporter substrate-binding protein [Motilibacteraceae bacterium]